MGWVLLAIFIGAVLGIGIAALGCGIACNGAETLGIAIVVVGWAAIAFFLTRIIKSITRDKKKTKAAPAESVPGTSAI